MREDKPGDEPPRGGVGTHEAPLGVGLVPPSGSRIQEGQEAGSLSLRQGPTVRVDGFRPRQGNYGSCSTLERRFLQRHGREMAGEGTGVGRRLNYVQEPPLNVVQLADAEAVSRQRRLGNREQHLPLT